MFTRHFLFAVLSFGALLLALDVTSQKLSQPSAGPRIVVAFTSSRADSAPYEGAAGPQATSAAVAGIMSGIAGVQFEGVVGSGIISITVDNTSKPVEEYLASLRSQPGIEYAEVDETRRFLRTPNDPMCTPQQQYNMFKIQAPQAWDVITEAAGDVPVCIIDGGFWYDHPDVSWSDARTKFPPDLFQPLTGDHGSHVAGIVSAIGNNDMGVAGVAWRSKLLTCAFIGGGCVSENFYCGQGGYVSDEYKCVQWCIANKAKVFSASFGGWPGDYPPSRLEEEAVALASLSGALWVTAAGNDPLELGWGPGQYKSYPASIQSDSNIRVANTDASDTLNPDSTYGKTVVQLAAPGTNILSTINNIAKWAVKDGSCQNPLPGPPLPEYEEWSGTSMSTPHVSGAIALLMSLAGSRLSALQIKEMLLRAVDVVPELQDRLTTGGRLNLWRAVQAVGFAFEHSSRPGETYVVYDIGRYCRIMNPQQLTAYGYTADTVVKQPDSVPFFTGTLSGPCPWPNGFYREQGSTTVRHFYTPRSHLYASFRIGGTSCTAAGARLNQLNGVSRTVEVPAGSLLPEGYFDTQECSVGMFRQKGDATNTVTVVFGPGQGQPKRLCTIADGRPQVQAWRQALGYRVQELRRRRFSALVTEGAQSLGSCIWPDGLYKQGTRYFKLYNGGIGEQAWHISAGDKFCRVRSQDALAVAGGEAAFTEVPESAGLTTGRAQVQVC